MLTAHEGQLNSFLTLVNDVGAATVRTSVLKGWFGATNASKSIWREISERWEDIGDCDQLLVGETEGNYTFVFGAGLTVTNDDGGWLVNIEDWC